MLQSAMRVTAKSHFNAYSRNEYVIQGFYREVRGKFLSSEPVFRPRFEIRASVIPGRSTASCRLIDIKVMSANKMSNISRLAHHIYIYICDSRRNVGRQLHRTSDATLSEKVDSEILSEDETDTSR